MLPCFRSAANAADGRSVAIKQSEIAIGPCVVELRVQVAHDAEFFFHFIYYLERTEEFSLRELRQIHSEVIMSWRRVRGHGDCLPSYRDSLLGNFGALGAFGGLVGKVECGAREL